MDYTYEMFQHSIDRLAEDIDITFENYDYVLGITRGGLIPAVFLSHRLGIPMLAINWSTRDSKIKTLDNHTKELLNNKKVLIVEDIIDSGETASQLIQELGTVCTYHIAALIYNVSQKIEPKYYDISIDRTVTEDWINFFWEV